MHYIRLSNGDEHFVENVRLAGEWAKEGSIQLTVKARAEGDGPKMTGQRKVFPVHRMSMHISTTFAEPIIRYSQFQEEKVTVSLRNVIEVAWRPDIRRYKRDQS